MDGDGLFPVWAAANGCLRTPRNDFARRGLRVRVPSSPPDLIWPFVPQGRSAQASRDIAGNALDHSTRVQLRALLRDVVTTRNIPTLLVSHDLGEVAALMPKQARQARKS